MPTNGRARGLPGKTPASSSGPSLGRQTLRREVNRRISERGDGSALDVFCECGQPRCSERLTIAADRYEEMRRVPTHFLIKPGHGGDEERLVGDFGEFVVVEKYGRSGVAAVRLAMRPVGTPA
jgi:hypothetical protein